MGSLGTCQSGPGWISGARNTTPPTPGPGPLCTDPGCTPSTNDAGWRVVNLPHDFVVEGNFSQEADMRCVCADQTRPCRPCGACGRVYRRRPAPFMHACMHHARTPAPSSSFACSHGYLPYGKAWYRKHFSVPAAYASATLWLDFEGIQTQSTVYLNGVALGSHLSGYTNSRYWLNNSLVNFGGADNLLAVFADGTKPVSVVAGRPTHGRCCSPCRRAATDPLPLCCLARCCSHCRTAGGTTAAASTARRG